MSQKQTNNISGSYNTIFQVNNSDSNHFSYHAENNYNISDYCERKKTIGLWKRAFFSVLGIIADVIAIFQFCIPLLYNNLVAKLTHKSNIYYLSLSATFSFKCTLRFQHANPETLVGLFV